MGHLKTWNTIAFASLPLWTQTLTDHTRWSISHSIRPPFVTICSSPTGTMKMAHGSKSLSPWSFWTTSNQATWPNCPGTGPLNTTWLELGCMQISPQIYHPPPQCCANGTPTIWAASSNPLAQKRTEPGPLRMALTPSGCCTAAEINEHSSSPKFPLNEGLNACYLNMTPSTFLRCCTIHLVFFMCSPTHLFFMCILTT